jgi:eukaryotic-like serine/threonine-protein kinase
VLGSRPVESVSAYPRRFGKYVLISPLAQGGMGEIHLAYSGQAELKKLCVIKTILGHLADEEFIARFLDEAKTVVKLSHGNLVPVFEAGNFEGQFFLAMEYIEGRDLRDVWNRLGEAQRTMPLDLALYIVREICRGLTYVHGFGDLHLVHRDVSPPNVLLSYTGEVKLTDFGVATSTIKLQKTAPGILLGKLSYMSPEQAKNEKVDARADIYSAGVILWELITGKRLFPPDKSQLERYERAINPLIAAPSTVNHSLPPVLDLVVARALSPQRESRIAEAELLRRELASQLAKLSPTTDALSLQALLKELYGPDITREREERHRLLEEMAPRIREIMEPPSAAAEKAAREPTEPAHMPDEPMLAPARLAPGTVLADRYDIKAYIGEGGMGTVYLATHVEIGKQVAVKVLHPVYSRMPDVVTRFRQEARAASKIGHPHIVEVYDSGTTSDGSVYFVMEKLDGVDLAEVLDAEGTVAIERAIDIGTQICEAVAAAHEAGIIHRDLKPENVFLTSREGTPDFVKILDFGIAKSMEIEEHSKRERLTYPGVAMGTPEYMAPEQAAGQSADRRADIYAVGALIYEMLVGQPPHSGENLMAVLKRKATEDVRPPRQIRPEVPEALERLVLWALSFKPEDRPQSMAQMIYELHKLTRGRAGAVATLLGIPGVSGPPVGPALAPPVSTSPLGPARPYYDTARVKPLDLPIPSQTVPWKGAAGWSRRRALPLALIAVALVAGAVVALRLGSSSRQKAGTGSASALGVTRRDGGRSLLDRRVVDRTPPDAGEPDEETTPDAGKGRKPVRKTHPVAQHYLKIGRQHLAHGDFAAAHHDFGLAAKNPKTRGAAQVGLAEVEFQLGRFKEAERIAKEAVKNGGGLRARLVLANVYFKLKSYAKAVKAYQQVLAIDPKHKEAQRNLDAAQKRLKSK